MLLLLTEPLFDLAADLFGDSLNLARFDLDSGIAAQIFGRLLEGCLAARTSHQSTHAGRIGGVDNVQALVIGETTLVALFALVKGACERDRSQGG